MEHAGSSPARSAIFNEICPRCNKPLDVVRFTSNDGFICHRCMGKERKAKRKRGKRK